MSMVTEITVAAVGVLPMKTVARRVAVWCSIAAMSSSDRSMAVQTTLEKMKCHESNRRQRRLQRVVGECRWCPDVILVAL